MARTTNGMARHLLAANEEQLRRLAPALMEHVAEELGMPRVSPDHQWPADVVEAIREFLTCVATDDLQSIGERGGIFEQVGVASAHGGVPFDQLAAGIRLAVRRTQGQVHRAVLAEGAADPEVVLELLARVVDAGEAVVEAALRGHELSSLGDEGGVGRRLASALLYGNADVTELAEEAGWPEGTLACAIVTDVEGAARIRQESPHEVAWFPRDSDVCLFHPVAEGRLATSLRPHLADHARAVGSATAVTELRSSLDLAQRAVALGGDAGSAVFADDHLLELTCSADAAVVLALRRKYFQALDELPADQRSVLVETLRAWLFHWGHRPGIAETLGVHPQTVSGRINRLKDLLSDDLDDPTVRSELLVLLIAESVAAARDSQGRAAIP